MSDAVAFLSRALKMLVGRGRVSAPVEDGQGVQFMQVKLGEMETRDKSPRLAEYGLTSNPPVGTDAVMVFIAGDRSNGIVIATGNQQYRMKGLASGEVAIYDNKGQSVYLSQSGIVVNGGGKPITVNNTPNVTVHASQSVLLDTPILKCTGDILDQCNGSGITMARMREIYDGHNHAVSGVRSGSDTVISQTTSQQQ